MTTDNSNTNNSTPTTVDDFPEDLLSEFSSGTPPPKSTQPATSEKEIASNKVKFQHYPLIGRYSLGKKQVEIIEKELDPSDPYHPMPYCDITDDGVVQVFFKKGTFTAETDVPEFRSFAQIDTTQKFPHRVEGPFKRQIIDYPYGYRNYPKKRTEYRFRLRINPEQMLVRQGPYWQLNPIEKFMCSRSYNSLSYLSPEEVRQNLRLLIEECSRLSIWKKRKVFCSGRYKLGKYFLNRLRGKAKSKQSLQRKLSRNYTWGKFLFNQITGEWDQVRPLNNTELVAMEQDLSKEPIKVELKEVPYILPVEYSHVHPLAQKLSTIKPERNEWGTFHGTWLPPEPKEPKKNRIQFRQIPFDPEVDPELNADAFTQIRYTIPMTRGIKP